MLRWLFYGALVLIAVEVIVNAYLYRQQLVSLAALALFGRLGYTWLAKHAGIRPRARRSGKGFAELALAAFAGWAAGRRQKGALDEALVRGAEVHIHAAPSRYRR